MIIESIFGVFLVIFRFIVNIFTFNWLKRREADIKLFRRLYSELEFGSNSAFLLKKHDFSQAFLFEYLQPLNYIVEDWDYPNNRFHSWRVERRKKRFLKDLKIFIDELGLHTAMDTATCMSIGLREADRRERAQKKKVARNLNKHSRKAYKSYVKFIKTYKNELSN